MSDPAPLVKVAVIGASGRDAADRRRLEPTFGLMATWVGELVRFLKDNNLAHHRVQLVSGGSAYGDHVAITAWHVFNDPNTNCPFEGGPFGGLLLHLPTPYDFEQRRFVRVRGDNDAARTLNDLHDRYRRVHHTSTLTQIAGALTIEGAKIEVHEGFLARDKAIARGAKFMIAFSGVDGVAPTKGSGTAFTWDRTSTTCVKRCVALPPEPEAAASDAVVASA